MNACLDCGADTVAIGEQFMLYDDLWSQLVPGGHGHLCVGCAEARLGRPLTSTDFHGEPFGWSRKSDRLLQRMGKAA